VEIAEKANLSCPAVSEQAAYFVKLGYLEESRADKYRIAEELPDTWLWTFD
jgi:DNA-binding IclR family transcriptional regulator